jgi:hypothetical protein
MSSLDDAYVKAQLRDAWLESQPGMPGAHEEGGFVLLLPDGSYRVERWPKGKQNEITVPVHTGGLRGGVPIVATFHTHPNPGADYQQEPSLTDVRAVRDDPELSGADYEGEYVISEKTVYRIRKDGTVEELGETSTLLSLP